MMKPNTSTGSALSLNPATRIIVSVVGILCGISGLEHGFIEILHGIAAPDSLFISAIGLAHRF